MRIGLLLIVAVVETGCVGTIRLYSGPELPADRVALVDVGSRGSRKPFGYGGYGNYPCTSFLKSVDGRVIGNELPWYRESIYFEFWAEVLPEPHMIVVTGRDGPHSGPPITLSFTAAAGCKYVPRCEFHFDEGNWRWSGWIEEVCESDSSPKRVSTEGTASLYVIDSILEEEARPEAPVTAPNEE